MCDNGGPASPGGLSRQLPPPLPGRCHYFLGGRKPRYCRSHAVPGQQYCGNHLNESAPSAAAARPQRVPCPIDPTHTVLQSELQLHLTKCPKLLDLQRERAQPHHVEDINAGSDTEPCLPPAPQPIAAAATAGAPEGATAPEAIPGASDPAPGPSAAAVDVGHAHTAAGSPGHGPCCPPGLVPALGPFQRGRAAQRAELARSLGREAFTALIQRVEAAYAAACGGTAPPARALRPPECAAMLEAPSDLRPFDLKHGLQQASIIGNMQHAKLIGPGPQGGSEVAVVELGAGKGYLGGTLVGCCGVRRLVVTDVRSGFKLKADRHLRHIHFSRYRVDLKDYVPAATPQLAALPPDSTPGPNPRPHGLADAHRLSPAPGAAPAAPSCSSPAPSSSSAAAAAAQDPPPPLHGQQQQAGEAAAAMAATAATTPVPWVAVGKHLCGAATDYALRGCLVSAEQAEKAKGATAASSAVVVAGGVPEGAGASSAAAAAAAGVAAGGKGKRQRRRGGGGQGPGRDGDAAAGARAATVGVGERQKEPGQGQGQGQAAHNAAAEGTERQDASAPHAIVTGGTPDAVSRGGNSIAEAEAAAADGITATGPSPLLSQPQAAAGSSATPPPPPAAAPASAPASAVFRGLAIAPCCHHRCGWRAYVGKPLFRRLGFSPQEFELISWMTGWALCGHDAPAGEGAGCCSDGEVGNDDDAEDREERNRSKAAGGTSGGRDGAMATAAGAADEAAAAALSGSKRARSPEAEAVGGGGDGGEGAAAAEEREAQAVAGVEGKPAQQELGQGFDPARCLSRIERMALGQKCKQLIEAGRLEWMRGRFGACELVCYVGPEVTGENRLLLAVA